MGARMVACVLWSRRWQLQDILLGGSPYELLSRAYEAEQIGIVQSEGEMDHDHDHGHDHGPRDIPVVGQRWAVVTGAANGIGRAAIRKLADQGFSLICVDLATPELDEVVVQAEKRLERGWRGGVWRRTAEPPAVIKIGCDVMDELVTRRVDAGLAKIQTAVERLPPGSLKMVVHSVGFCTVAPKHFAGFDHEEVERLVQINLHHVIQLTAALWPHLIATPQGRRAGILFLSSREAMLPAPYAAVYAATKAALCAFATAIRAEAIGLGQRVDVLCVTPGYVRSGQSPRWLGDPRGLAEPDDVMHASLLLLETAACATMTPSMCEALVHTLLCMLPEDRLAQVIYARRTLLRPKAVEWDESNHCCLCLQQYKDRTGKAQLVPCAHNVCGQCAQGLPTCPTCKASVAGRAKVDHQD
eukprot:CAMPEP_0115836838 /NCGR_PEP_ID=MMETSP0287-20121206/4914_1 /TAXON_ID=412157 /ORGANISM="Chrysochromulina rotalis, Strain UIO044" /LENGTH=413 /DNA_ID=CAMNT_0003290335 /DNA_START=30 /DNA_END=1271 /DNA_ORIENTATION=-